ncbi:DUF1345 domain-containing protein [Janthinobacterium aestuarii]
MKITLPFRSFIRSRPHLSMATAIGVAAGLLLPASWQQMTRLLTAWNVAVWFYLATMAWMMMRANHHKVKAMAARQDERAATVLSALSVASVMSLVAIVSQLSSMKDLAPDERALHYGLTIATLVGSWFLVGTLFCFHYAHLYYQADPALRPLKFPDGEQNPDYWDFLYFAFTIAVAVQTSDVSVQTRMMRQIVLGQSVLSFFFNLVVLGLSINIAAGLING